MPSSSDDRPVASLADELGGEASPEVVEAIERAIVTARAVWPRLAVSELAYARGLLAVVADEPDAVAALARLHVADLWLVAACAAGERRALAELDGHLGTLRPTLARMAPSQDAVDEILQRLRTRLLSSSEGRPPRILSYSGRGALRRWLKVTVVREGTRVVRKVRADSPQTDEIDALMDSAEDPELAAMREHYRGAFREAFGRALDRLEPRDRNVLRYHLMESLSIDEIAGIYRVHRATAARWLARIRERLYQTTREDLMQKLAVDPRELDSVMRLIQSRLDASISVKLGTEGDADA